MGDNNTGMSGEISKKSFEYKVSKKVAELIQVVHMLFTKNHERELELETTKEAYEQEIENIIRDARNQLSQIQQSLDDEKRRGELRVKKIELESSAKEKQLQEKCKEASDKYKESDRSLILLRREKNDLEQQLHQAKIENERLQQTIDQSLKSHVGGALDEVSPGKQNEAAAELRDVTTELTNCQVELEKRLANEEYLGQQLEHQKIHFETLVEALKKDLGRAKLSVRNDADILRHQLTEATRTRERLEQKNRNLEMDLKQAKKESDERRRSVMSVNSDGNTLPVTAWESQTNQTQKNLSKHSPQDNLTEREELDKLRREIRWYRMELSNREGNFNRMFTDSAPVRIAGRVGSLAVTRNNNNKNEVHLSSPRKPQIHSLSHDGRLTRTRAGHERLPALGMEFRQRAATRMETSGFR